MRNLRRVGKRFYYDHGGKPRVWEPLGDNEAVAKAKAEKIAESKRVQTGTVDAMLRDCLEVAKVAPGTLVNYRTYRKHLSAVFGYLRPDEITQADVLQYLDACPRMSFRGEVALLSQAYANWMRLRRLTFNPCFGVRCRRKGSKRDRLLADGELGAIIAKADEPTRVAIELAYALGLRIGDLCSLRWQDVGEAVRTAKTGARQDFEAAPWLDVLLSRARALQAKIGSLYVLCDKGGAKLTPSKLRYRWERACEKAKVMDANFHDIRAKAGTDKERQEGRDAAQRFLGHRDPRTTDVYLRDKRANVVKPLRRRG